MKQVSASSALCLLTMCGGLFATKNITDIDLVDVQEVNPNINVCLYFSAPNNFTGKAFYNEDAKAFLRSSAARALSDVQEELEEMNLGIVVLDAYRPLSIQKALWKCCPDEEYVVNPNVACCRHHCGLAVDVMLLDLTDGEFLAMPSLFFGDNCTRNYKNVKSNEAKCYCKLLELVMEKHGFVGLTTEWWHFDFKSRERCDALDISFEELATH